MFLNRKNKVVKKTLISDESDKGVTRPHSPVVLGSDECHSKRYINVQAKPGDSICTKITSKGKRCRNRAMIERDFCGVHNPFQPDEVKQMRLDALVLAGQRNKELLKASGRLAGARKALMLPESITNAGYVIDFLHGLSCQCAGGKLDPKVLQAVSSACRTILTSLELRRKTGGSKKLRIILKPKVAPPPMGRYDPVTKTHDKAESPQLTHEIERVEIEISVPLEPED